MSDSGGWREPLSEDSLVIQHGTPRGRILMPAAGQDRFVERFNRVYAAVGLRLETKKPSPASNDADKGSGPD